MKKVLKRIGICTLAVCLLCCGLILRDKQTLRENLIRLHVVGASNSDKDQALKLQVRDAIVENLQENMAHLTDMTQAKAYLQAHLREIEEVANEVLREAGSRDVAQVSLRQEEFVTRYYDTFTLPAGVYESLRITIGSGAGRNWWCVVFPTLCVGATVEEFSETAVSAGFSEGLAETLAGEEGYEVRFFLLDTLGKLENFLHKG